MAILRKTLIATFVCLSFLPGQTAMADCVHAASSYISAISSVNNVLRRYTRCLSNSNGHDDCSKEFSKLQDAQSAFESAVSQYESECH
jgi:hypothetical protein